jgi:hypothetical protein
MQLSGGTGTCPQARYAGATSGNCSDVMPSRPCQSPLEQNRTEPTEMCVEQVLVPDNNYCTTTTTST